MFSFNSPYRACLHVTVWVLYMEIDRDLMIQTETCLCLRRYLGSGLEQRE